MNLKFRNLKANEIECRVGMAKQNGCSLLLYKDARVDMQLLDEVVTPLKWQRSHSRDNANCQVCIWSDDLNQWVCKEDVGTESNTEKAKGLASDSFKRACVNWGIGRELYSAPFIWINLNQGETYESGKDRNNKPKYKLNAKVKFTVTAIEYNPDNTIKSLQIKDQNNVVRFGNGKNNQTNRPEQVDRITEDQLNELETLMMGVDIDLVAFKNYFKISNVSDLKVSQFNKAMAMVKKKAEGN